MSNNVIQLSEISARTGVPVGTLRWYRHSGIGPKTFKLGGRVVAYESDVDAWVREQYEAENGSPTAKVGA